MRRLGIALLASVLLAGCVQTRQYADVEFTPPQGDYRLLVMRPDVSVGSVTTGGLVEPRADWTETSRAKLGIREIAAPPPHRTLAVIWRKASPLGRTLGAVAAAIREIYPRVAAVKHSSASQRAANRKPNRKRTSRRARDGVS